MNSSKAFAPALIHLSSFLPLLHMESQAKQSITHYIHHVGAQAIRLLSDHGNQLVGEEVDETCLRSPFVGAQLTWRCCAVSGEVCPAEFNNKMQLHYFTCMNGISINFKIAQLGWYN